MAIPSVNQEFTAHNPDGSTIQLFATGTPAAATFESADGHAVVRNPDTGFYEHAQSSAVQAHVATAPTADRSRWQERRRNRTVLRDRPADATAEARRPAAPTNVVGLCLLVQFPHETTAGFSRSEVDDFCNKTGYSAFGNNGSVFDYFQDVSERRLSYTNVVVDYFTAAHDRSYYTDETVTQFSRAKELGVEGLDHLKATGFDFNRLTVDDGGFVYALNLFYTGENTNTFGQGLWPHQNSLVDDYAAPDDRTFRDYQITDMRTELTLGTFVHESGHLVCDFPDMYNVFNLDSRGAGGFCLMGHFTQNPDFRTNPVQVSGYLKRVARWTTRETVLTAGMLEHVDAGLNDFLLYRKNATEYFLLENRQQQGRDLHLPDAGVAIWHVDELGTEQTSEISSARHYELSLEQADGEFHLEKGHNYGDDRDLWGRPKLEFSAATIPNTKWWNLAKSGLEIVEISAPALRMSVRTEGYVQLAVPAFGYDQGSWRVDRHPRLLADMSARGQVDIVGFAEDGVWIAQSTSLGTFGAPLQKLTHLGAGDAAGNWRTDRHIRTVGDISNISTGLDLVGFRDHGVLMYPNNGDGTFGGVQRVVADFGFEEGGWRVDKHLRLVQDITGDGKADIIGFGDDAVLAYLNNGDGTFGDIVLAIADFCFNKGWRIDRHPRFIGNIAGGGHADVIGFHDDGVYFAPNNGTGDGSYGGIRKATGEFGYNDGWRVDKHPRFLAPLVRREPGSTLLDIVGFSDDGVRVAINTGNGTFIPSTLAVPNYGLVAGHWKVAQHPRFMVDLTGDGTADIVGFGSDGVFVSLNDGLAHFSPPRLVVPNFGSSEKGGHWQVDKHPRLLGDITGDGRPDIVGFGFDGVFASLNNSLGRF